MIEQTYFGGEMNLDAMGGLNEASTSAIPGFKETTNFRPRYSNDTQSKKKKKLISTFFSDHSRLGMEYEDKVIDNMRAIPADKNLLPKENQLVMQDLFTLANKNWKVKTNQDKNFFDKDLSAKRESLRRLAVQPELEDILDTFTDEAVVYDSDLLYFMTPYIDQLEMGDLKAKVRKQIEHDLNEHFRHLYKMLGWKTRAWDLFKRWLIEGCLAWEIVWDSLEKPTKIIGMIAIDPATLTKKFKNNKWYWVQFSGVQGRERTLLDSQVVYIAYDEDSSINRTSYLERLVRPYNIYRIIEQAQIIWTVTNASFKMQFTIPIKGMSKVLGTQTLNTAMNRYREDIKFNAESGELQINGNAAMPFNKEYWIPESDSGTPTIETIGGDGPDLSDNDQLKYFRNQLYKISKIPLNRFDQESGETWFGSDPTSASRTEISFSRYVTRLRNIFAQIMIKPLRLWMALSHPELGRDIVDAIGCKWNTYNPFEEMLTIELMAKRVDHIQTMKDALVDCDVNGNDIKFFSSKWLVQKFLGVSTQDLENNEKLKKEEIEELHLAGSEISDEAATGA